LSDKYGYPPKTYRLSGYELSEQSLNWQMKIANRQIGVIFDLDGVLVDTGPFHKQSWYDLAAKEGLDMSDELFYSTFGMQNYKIIPILVGRQVPAEEIERMSEWKEQRYRELIADKLELMEGARMLLEDLKGNGFLLAIGSSAPRANLDVVLKCCNICDYFDACVTGEDVRSSKPAPDTFLKAAEKLKLPPQRCVVVEDSVPGVQAGKAAGMAVVAITTTRRRLDLKDADMIIDGFTELSTDIFINLLTDISA
jgi:beta-phosphoglucomutase